MDKRKLHLSVLAGILALVMVIGMSLPMEADAARSDELRAQLSAQPSQAAGISDHISERGW